MSETHNRYPNTICKVCSLPIYRRPNEIKRGNCYCSRQCCGKANQQPHDCPICGKVVLAGQRSKTCSRACSNKGRTGIKYTGEELHSKSKQGNILKEKLIKLVGEVCQSCGYDNKNILHAHHILEKCNGGNDELDNLKLLCPNCHYTIHYGDSRKII